MNFLNVFSRWRSYGSAYIFRPMSFWTSKKQSSTMPQPQTPEIKTLVWKEVGNLSIQADVYLPPEIKSGVKRPIAMLFHGGGHVMFSRKQVKQEQITLLLKHGFLPVSFDFRFCPELNVLDGPMTDVCDALRWSRSQLPSLAPTLASGLEADGEKVAAVGWSTGGHLSMTLGFTAAQRGLKAPEAILAFYSPTDYESDYWRNPIFLKWSSSKPDEPYDVLEGFQKEPITSHFPSGRPGMISLEDPRCRFVLHMTWRGQSVPFLLRGPSYDPSDTSYPTKAEVQSISPYAHILDGTFRTPTFMVQGKDDDLIPWKQSWRTVETLKEKGIEADIEIVEGAGHVFDSFPPPGLVVEPSLARAYGWLSKTVSGS